MIEFTSEQKAVLDEIAKLHVREINTGVELAAKLDAVMEDVPSSEETLWAVAKYVTRKICADPELKTDNISEGELTNAFYTMMSIGAKQEKLQ